MTGQDALLAIKGKSLVVLDIETTGTNPHLGDNVFMIGMMRLDNIEDKSPKTTIYRFNVDIFTGKQYSVVERGRVNISSKYVRLIKDPTAYGYGHEERLAIVNAIDPKILNEIVRIFDDENCLIILHNSLFDINFLAEEMKKSISVFKKTNERMRYWADNIHKLWDENRIWDTMVISHYLQNNAPHGLKELGIWLFQKSNIEEERLKGEVSNCKKMLQKLFNYVGEKFNLDERDKSKMANVVRKPCYYLPQMVRMLKDNIRHYRESTGYYIGSRIECLSFLEEVKIKTSQLEEFLNFTVKDEVVGQYLENDLMLTYSLFLSQLDEIGSNDEFIIEIARWKNRCLGSLARIMDSGVSMNMKVWQELHDKYESEKIKSNAEIQQLSQKFLNAEVNCNSSKQLIALLKAIKPDIGFPFTEKGQESLNAQFLTSLKEKLESKNELSEEEVNVLSTVKTLLNYRKYEKSLEYLDEYNELSYDHPVYEGFRVLHTKYNPVGTLTTRLSSSEPNLQNIGRGELRKVFGPVPGKLWFSIDYTNIELRIFAYASGSEDLIKAFEEKRNVHCIIGRLVWEDEWAVCEKVARLHPAWDSANDIERDNMISSEFKSKFPELYQKVKNGNFSIIYGASETKADLTYGKNGAYAKVMSRLTKVDEFIQRVGDHAYKYGCVVLLPNKLNIRLHVGDKQHVAVNYFIQGSAGNVLAIATRYVHDYFVNEHPDCAIIMTIHDELVVEIPKEKEEVINEVVKRMTSKEFTGKWFNFPLEVGVDKHDEFWK